MKVPGMVTGWTKDDGVGFSHPGRGCGGRQLSPPFGAGRSLLVALVATAVLVSTVGVAPTAASEVSIFRLDRHETMAKGTFDGVSANARGHVELARRVTRLASLDEPFVFSAAGLADGWAVGTGQRGKILQISAEGEVEVLAILGELGVFALLADGDHLLAATSPDGAIHRIDPSTGEGEELFDPEATYIWDMARDREGRLLVATGSPGQLLRIDAKGRSEVLYRSRDGHVRALEPLDDGGVLIGTAGQGLIVRIDADGSATTIHDAIHPEVLDFARAADGTIYAALLASEASLVDLSGKGSKTGAEGGEEAQVTVVEGSQQTVGSRGSGFEGKRSLVLALDARALRGQGGVEEVASFAEETLHSLLWHDGVLWLGTGQGGGLYRLGEDRPVLERKLEESQVAALAAGGAGAGAATANASAFYRLENERVAEGSYTSETFDTGQVARFGTFQWLGSTPSPDAVELAFRSGLSQTPDATWSPWQPAEGVASSGGTADRRHEVALGGLPSGRFVQWRATLRRGAKDGPAPRLELAELSYRQENRRPEIEGLEVLAPGEILVPTSFNPQNQTFEPWSPNRDGIFTTLVAELGGEEGRLKTLWKKGYRTLRWKASDPNEDPLVYRLEFRPESSDAEGWLPMAETVEEVYYSFDSTVLPDGVYRFRLIADDQRGAQLPGEAAQDKEISGPVVIDHSPPRLLGVERRGGRLTVEVEDGHEPLREAAISVDAGPWKPQTAADGLLDSRRETLEIEAPEDARMVLLRLTDAAFNVITYELLSK